MHSPHQHGNSAAFLKVIPGRRKQTEWKKLVIRNPKYRGLERDNSAVKCALLCREPWVSSQHPHELQFQGT